MGKTFRKERSDNRGKRSTVQKPKKDVRSYKGFSIKDIKEEDFFDEEE